MFYLAAIVVTVPALLYCAYAYFVNDPCPISEDEDYDRWIC